MADGLLPADPSQALVLAQSHSRGRRPEQDIDIEALVLAGLSQEDTLALLEDGGGNRKRYSGNKAPRKGRRFGLLEDKPFKPLPYVDLPVGLEENEVEQFLREQRLEDLHVKIQRGLLDEIDPDIRPPSPPPIYDKSGNRLNTREQRVKKAMMAEYNRLIRYMIKTIDGYTPPENWKPQRLVKKVLIPVEKYPTAPFMGVIIGARGVNHKRLQEVSGCRIFIRGKDVSDKFQDDEEMRMPQHVHIEGDTEAQIEIADKLIAPLINPESPEFEYARTHGMQQLAQVNGFSVSKMEARCSICGAIGHLGFDCPESNVQNYKMANVVCAICGDKGHVASDCIQAKEKHQKENVDWKEEAEKKHTMDAEYIKMMNELGVEPTATHIPVGCEPNTFGVKLTPVPELPSEAPAQPPPPQSQVRPSFRKSKLCNNWQSGSCPRGESCTFAHGDHEIGNPQESQGRTSFKKSKLCNNWQSGSCPREICTFAHGDHELGTPQMSNQAQMPQVMRPPMPQPPGQNPMSVHESNKAISALLAQQRHMGACGSGSGPVMSGSQVVSAQMRPIIQPWAQASHPQMPLQTRYQPQAPAGSWAGATPAGPWAGSDAGAMASNNFPSRPPIMRSRAAQPAIIRGSPDVDESILCPLHLTAMATRALYEMTRDTGARMSIDSAHPEPGGQRVLVQGPEQVRSRAMMHFRAWLSVQTGSNLPEDSFPPSDIPSGMPPGMGFPPEGFPPAGYPPGMSSPTAAFPPAGFPPVGFPPGITSPPDGFPPVGFPSGMASTPAGFHPVMSTPLPTGFPAMSTGPPNGFPPGFPPSGSPVVIDLDMDGDEVVVAPGMAEGFGVTWDEL